MFLTEAAAQVLKPPSDAPAVDNGNDPATQEKINEVTYRFYVDQSCTSASCQRYMSRKYMNKRIWIPWLNFRVDVVAQKCLVN